MKDKLEGYFEILRESGIKLLITGHLIVLVGPLSAVVVEEDILDLGDTELIMAMYPEVKKMNRKSVDMILKEQKSVYYNTRSGNWIY